MDIKLDWMKLKDSESFHDKRKALKIVESLPYLEIQDPLINWFTTCNSIEIKSGLLHLLTNDSKVKLFKNKKNISEFINSIDELELKEVIVDFLIIQNYLDRFETSGIIWVIKEYKELKNIGLIEARKRIEPFWVENSNSLK